MAYEDTFTDPTAPKGYLKPGDPGYRQTPWAPDYDPGPNWNNGVAPPPPTGRYDYNNGSPVNDPSEVLKAGNGWEWQGPQTPTWNATSNQWDRGVWNQKTGGGIGYTPTPTTTGGGGGGSVPSVPAPAGAPSSAPGMPNFSGIGQTTTTPIQSAYQDALLKYLSKSQEAPSLTDSTLSPQVEVFRVQQQRNQERQRLQAAERAAATGQSESGYLDTMISKGLQDQGFNTAAFNANLLGRETDKRNDQLVAALQLAQATGNSEAARELQAQLGGGDLSLRLMQTLLGQDNFYDQLGVNTALSQEGLNQRALQILYGGTQ
jgi:hypothetical protein